MDDIDVINARRPRAVSFVRFSVSALLLVSAVVPLSVAAQTAPALPQLIARIDAVIATEVQEDRQLSQTANTISEKITTLRADQQRTIQDEERLQADQERLDAEIKDVNHELSSYLTAIAENESEIDDFNQRCAGVTSKQDAYAECLREKSDLAAKQDQLFAVAQTWKTKKETLQGQFDNNESLFKKDAADWFSRDAKLKSLTRQFQNAKERRAKIAHHRDRMKFLRAKIIAADCPAARAGTVTELRLKCGNVEFDYTNSNLPALQGICPQCVVPNPV